MPSSLFQYEMLPTTWFYLSALIIIAVFFKFNRFWSVRNFDLIGLLLLAPGLLFLAMSDNYWGYIWLFGCGFLFCIRLFLDLLMVRRPLLEPNLNPAGMSLAVILLVAFMGANISINRGATIDSVRMLRLEQICTLNDWQTNEKPLQFRVAGFRPFLALTDLTNQVMAPDRDFLPAYLEEKAVITSKSDSPNGGLSESRNTETTFQQIFAALFGSPIPLVVTENNSVVQNHIEVEKDEVSTLSQPSEQAETTPDALRGMVVPVSYVYQSSDSQSPTTDPQTPPLPLQIAKPKKQYSAWFESFVIFLVMIGHIAIVIGLVQIGHCHFNNLVTGISAAMLYLLLPYVNQMTGRLDHVIPGALIIWAIALYRRPLFSGLCIGGAASLMFHPIFLVPLWCSYYWKRGLFRFLIGTVGIILVFYLLLLFSPREYGSYDEQWLNMLGAYNLTLHAPDGFWEDFSPVYRIPIMVIFVIYCVGVIFWPSRKHLATLMCCSTIILLGLQFWQAHQGGLYMAWYLPLLIITLFRPNLEDRVATAFVIDY